MRVAGYERCSPAFIVLPFAVHRLPLRAACWTPPLYTYRACVTAFGADTCHTCLRAALDGTCGRAVRDTTVYYLGHTTYNAPYATARLPHALLHSCAATCLLHTACHTRASFLVPHARAACRDDALHLPLPPRHLPAFLRAFNVTGGKTTRVAGYGTYLARRFPHRCGGLLTFWDRTACAGATTAPHRGIQRRIHRPCAASAARLAFSRTVGGRRHCNANLAPFHALQQRLPLPLSGRYCFGYRCHTHRDGQQNDAFGDTALRRQATACLPSPACHHPRNHLERDSSDLDDDTRPFPTNPVALLLAFAI